MSRSYRSGLVILALLSLVDLAGPLATDGEHPPMWVALIGSLLGLGSLVCVVLAWRGVTRAIMPLVGLRLLSSVTALPAFFVSDVPGPVIGLAAVLVLLTLAGIALVIGARDRRPVAA